MLISEETEKRILDILAAISSSFSVFMLGKELGQGTIRALSGALTTSRLTFLEQSFLAGKLASEIGTDNLRKMTQAQLMDWVRNNNLQLDEVEKAALSGLRRDTERYLAGRTTTWQQRFRSELISADKAWRATIAGESFTDAQAISLARNQSLDELIASLNGANAAFKSDINRIVQSEMNAYFQTGQTAKIKDDEEVYKIPRVGACVHCMRLHLNNKGGPKIYKMKDVRGNSNIGKKAGQWKFVIGPTHPYCYCILHR